MRDLPLPRANPDLLVRPRLLALLDQAAPLTLLLAPAGAGKSVLALQWATAARARGEGVVWLDGEVDGPSDVVAALAGGEAEPDAGVAPAEALRRLRRARPRPTAPDRRVTVVLDHAEPLVEALGDDLIAVARDVPTVHLVVCLRRRLEPLARALLAARTRVVGLAELQLTAPELQLLARRHGLGLGVEEAQRIHEAIGGWPVLARMGFEQQPALPGSADPPAATWSPRHLAWSLESELSRALPPAAIAALCRAALVEQPTWGAVRAATGPLDPAARGALEDIGLLDPLVTEGRPMLRLPPLPAQLFRRWYAERGLGSEIEVHQRVIDHWLAAGDPHAALHQALLGRCWALAVAIVEEHWWAVAGADLRAIPAAELPGHPRAELARLVSLPDDRWPGSPASRAAEAELLAGPPARLADRAGDPDALALLTLALLHRRARGRHEEALDLARRVEVVLGATGASTEGARRAALEAGRTRLLAGMTGSAARLLRACGAPEAAPELALTAALTGDLAGVGHWQERGGGAGPAGRVARAWEAVQRLDRDGSAQALAGTFSEAEAEAEDAGEWWPVVAWAAAERALAWGGRRRVLAQLTLARDAPARARDSVWQRLLLDAAEADLCLSLGRVAPAAQLLADVDRDCPSAPALLARARWARVVGRGEEATSLLEALADRGVVARSVEVERLLLLAWCRDADADAAAHALASAVEAAAPHGLVLPFAHVPGSLLAAHLRTVPELGAISARLRTTGVRAAYDVVEEVPALTPREQTVLAALARGLSLAQIGEELYVSRNTVKTQTTSLYRKLGVRGRVEAVRKGRRVGLV